MEESGSIVIPIGIEKKKKLDIIAKRLGIDVEKVISCIIDEWIEKRKFIADSKQTDITSWMQKRCF